MFPRESNTGLGFRVQGLGFHKGSIFVRLRERGLGFKSWGLGFAINGLQFRVRGVSGTPCWRERPYVIVGATCFRSFVESPGLSLVIRQRP